MANSRGRRDNKGAKMNREFINYLAFLEKRLARRNYAAMLLADKIRNGYLEKADTEELERKGKKAAIDFEATYDFNEEYSGLSGKANPDYISYVRISSDNISRLRAEVITRRKFDKFIERLEREEFE